MLGRFLLAGFLAVTGAALAQQQVSFVACPIVRDTKTTPCYLAEHDGETYYLGNDDAHTPELKHEVLVEGTVAAGARVCGGVPLQPVSVSVLKEVNLACNTLLPAEPGIDAPAPTKHANEHALNQNGRFTILYSFDEDHLDARGERVLNEAAEYAKSVHATKVAVTGYRASTTLSNGQTLTEKSGIAEKRAQNIAELLRGLGAKNVMAAWKSEPESAHDGQTASSLRRVYITIEP